MGGRVLVIPIKTQIVYNWPFVTLSVACIGVSFIAISPLKCADNIKFPLGS